MKKILAVMVVAAVPALAPAAQAQNPSLDDLFTRVSPTVLYLIGTLLVTQAAVIATSVCPGESGLSSMTGLVSSTKEGCSM